MIVKIQILRDDGAVIDEIINRVDHRSERCYDPQAPIVDGALVLSGWVWTPHVGIRDLPEPPPHPDHTAG